MESKEDEYVAFLEDSQLYFSQNDYDTSALTNYINSLNRYIKGLFDNKKNEKILEIEKKYNIEEIYNRIPKVIWNFSKLC